MAKKTNKTDHVLNLLSGGGPKNEAENNKEAGPAPPVIPEGTVSVVESVDEDGQIADTIRKSLEQELEKMERVPVSQVTALKSASEIHSPLDVEKPETEETPGKVVNKPIEEMAAESRAPEAAKTAAEEIKAPVSEAAEEIQVPVSGAAEEMQAPASKGAEELAKKETETPATEFKDVQKSAENGLSRVEAPETKFILVNVMERLVHEKAHYYMEQFGVCTCPRCTADVTALALTKLPPKYVVVNKEAVSPLINFYSNKYAGQITVEITKACIRVGENPYHSED